MSSERIIEQSITPASKSSPMLWILIALFLVGAASLFYGLSGDKAMIDFPQLTVTYLYLMGISQAGIVFCAVMRLCNAQWSKPYYRLAQLCTMAFFPFAILIYLLIYAYARNELFYWLAPPPGAHLSPWLDINFLLVRDLFGLFLFYGLSAFYFWKGLKPDLGAGQNDEATNRETERQLYALSPWVLLTFVLCNTFLAWDFAMMVIPHWHSTVFPIYFWFGSVFAGCAALIALPVVMNRLHGEKSKFGPYQTKALGMLITGFTLMWLYFFWAQFFVIWFGNLPHESEPLWRQMYGHYAPYYWTMMAGCFFIPFVSFLFAPVKRSLVAMSLLALAINIGMWINRYLMIVPVYAPDDTPFSHWIDIAIAIGMLAGFLSLLILMARRYPVYSDWEIALPLKKRS